MTRKPSPEYTSEEVRDVSTAVYTASFAENNDMGAFRAKCAEDGVDPEARLRTRAACYDATTRRYLAVLTPRLAIRK